MKSVISHGTILYYPFTLIHVNEGKWIHCFQELHTTEMEGKHEILKEETVRIIVNIDEDDIEKAIKSTKNRKSEVTKLIKKVPRQFLGNGWKM